MSMLSNVDIYKEIESGSLTIDPYEPEMVRGCSITLHLGEELLIPLPDQIVDVKNPHPLAYHRHVIPSDDAYLLNPGAFVLGHTLQRVTIGASLGFLIEGRSTLARVGLTIVQTAMLVYPGHANRCITLEFANHGPNPIKMYTHMKIARAALLRLSSPSTEKYDEKGKYRNQEKVGPPLFENEFFNQIIVKKDVSP
jgi:dCTP deaminase